MPARSPVTVVRTVLSDAAAAVRERRSTFAPPAGGVPAAHDTSRASRESLSSTGPGVSACVQRMADDDVTSPAATPRPNGWLAACAVEMWSPRAMKPMTNGIRPAN